VLDIATTVIDTLVSSYEYISRSELIAILIRKVNGLVTDDELMTVEMTCKPTQTSLKIYETFFDVCFMDGRQFEYIKMIDIRNLFKQYLIWFNRKYATEYKYDRLKIDEEVIKRFGPCKERGYVEYMLDGKRVKEQPHNCYIGYKLNFDFGNQDIYDK
jgi:hypothetical protein